MQSSYIKRKKTNLQICEFGAFRFRVAIAARMLAPKSTSATDRVLQLGFLALGITLLDHLLHENSYS